MGFANTHTLIAKGTKIIGDLYFAGDLQIEGEIKVTSMPKPVPKPAWLWRARPGGGRNPALSSGDQRPGHGDVYSTKHLELAAKASVTGNVYYQLMRWLGCAGERQPSSPRRRSACARR